MTAFINHRINTIEQLRDVPKSNGAEVDIRYHNDELVLHHDPFGHHSSKPTRFNDFLAEYDLSGPLILNIKSEGIEQTCIDLIRAHDITNWFFLDLSMPMCVIFAGQAARGEIDGFAPENLAVRFSEHEPLEYALAFAGKAGWVWVDCFTHLPMTATIAEQLQDAGFRTCIVSPELQRHDLSRIAEFREQLAEIPVSAVCTKRPDLWGQI